MYDEENDILEAASNAAAHQKFQTEPLWIVEWEKWVTITAIRADRRSKLLESCIKVERRGGRNVNKPDLDTMYPLLAVMCTLNPISTDLPDKAHPHFAKYPGAKDEQGEYLTPPHPKAGKAPFKPEHLSILNQNSGAVLERISAVAQRLNLLRPEDLEQKKESLEERRKEIEISISELQEISEE